MKKLLLGAALLAGCNSPSQPDEHRLKIVSESCFWVEAYSNKACTVRIDCSTELTTKMDIVFKDTIALFIEQGTDCGNCSRYVVFTNDTSIVFP